MIDRIESLLGRSEIADFSASIRQFPPRGVRVRQDRGDVVLPFEWEVVPWSKVGRRLIDSNVRPGGFLQYAAADYYIQDPASLLPIELAQIEPGDRVMDVCAAPGGKSTAIAERLGRGGVLVANEVIRSRVDVLRYSLARTGRANYAITNDDPATLESKFRGAFSKVILDVPCSGQTLLGRAKHDENAFSSTQVAYCAARAQRILDHSIRLLEVGGLLVFSTCTFSMEENESQIEWLMREYPGAWEPQSVPGFEQWQSPMLSGGYRLWPHRDRCAGGFVAVLKLVSDLPEGNYATSSTPGIHASESGLVEYRSAKSGRGDSAGTSARRRGERDDSRRGHGAPTSKRSGDSKSNKLQREEWQHANDLMEELGELRLQIEHRDGQLLMMEDGLANWIAERFETIEGVNRGMSLPLGMLKVGKHWEPSHALAMLQSPLFRPTQSFVLEEESAGLYAEGNSLSGVGVVAGVETFLGATEEASGSDGASSCRTSRESSWGVACWAGRPLGWLKRVGGTKQPRTTSPSDLGGRCDLGGRWNNHLPIWARLKNLAGQDAGPLA
jgi:16S rRNA C967 or C1407 C5-methylase (RsmB/RsmF family)